MKDLLDCAARHANLTPMPRKLKFRVWVPDTKKFFYLELQGKKHSTEGCTKDSTQWNFFSSMSVTWQPLVYSGKTEIYEGDIVEYDMRDGGAEVIWDEDDCSYYLKPIDNCPWMDIFLDKRRWDRLEVVGNIFQ